MTLDTVAQWGGWVVGLFTVGATIVQNRRKSDVDESALVLKAWKELMDTTERRVSSLVAEVESLQKRLAVAEARISEMQGERSAYLARIEGLETENRGLKASIAQNSKSAAFLLERNAKRSADGRDNLQEQIAALDQAGHNSKGDV